VASLPLSRKGRVVFQRILTYTLNSITKKIVQVLLLAVGLIMTGHAILTPLLMVLIMITGDFLGIVAGRLTMFAHCAGAECVAVLQSDGCGHHHGNWRIALLRVVLVFATYRLGFDLERLRTLAFIVIVFGNQATTYTNRERQRLWSSRRVSGLLFHPSPISRLHRR